MVDQPAPARAPLLVGVDVGTTNIKALVVDLDGRVVASASAPTPIVYPRPEWAEYDAEILWRVSAGAIREALTRIDDTDRVQGIAFASMGETAVPLDAAGAATGPAIAWFDKRTRAEVDWIVAQVGQDRLFEISGLAPDPIYGLCKLLWHKRHRPEAFARTCKWLNVADFFAWKLTGEMATDFSLACRTYALDLGALRWSDAILSTVGVAPSLLAPLARSGLAVGRVSAEGAAATGLPRHCVVAAGGHDHLVGALAVDAMRPGLLLNSTGTTEAVLMGTTRPGRDPALGRSGYAQGVIVVEQPIWYVIGGLFTAGGAIEWFRRAVAIGADYETLVAEAEAAPAGSLGVGFLPHLRLGTAPRPDSHARGAFFGLNTDITRGCLFRAVLEGIAADSLLCGEGMLELIPAPPPDEVRVIGGLTRNKLYMKIKASLVGRPIAMVDLPDSVAIGAALLAGLGAGCYQNLADAHGRLRPSLTEIRPDPGLVGFYDRLVREVYAPAVRLMQPVHERVHILQTDRGGPTAVG